MAHGDGPSRPARRRRRGDVCKEVASLTVCAALRCMESHTGRKREVISMTLRMPHPLVVFVQLRGVALGPGRESKLPRLRESLEKKATFLVPFAR